MNSEESERLSVTLTKKVINLIKALHWFFSSFVSILCSLCHVNKGVWDVKFLFLPLFVSVCITHVWVFLVSKAYFVLFSSYQSLWEDGVCSAHGWLSPQHLLPSPLPNRARFPFGDLGFQGCWFQTQLHVLFRLCRKASIARFLVRSKTQGLSTGLQGSLQSGPVTLTSSSTTSPPPLCPFTLAPALP